MSASDDRRPVSRAASSLGGIRAAANMTPEERSERSRAAAAVRWAKDAERRAAEGLPPRKKPLPEPSAAELEPWLDEADRRFPDREWPNREARRRQAIILWRTAAAEAVAAAFKNANEAGA
ncbi:hypothetical protein J2D78_09840 [Microbacterium maritypicum]|uniref:hypothetical protein n=1 Tax=Microbacterium maritypicum TaxID=33918 RepID=UPI001B344B13|nr:hypothetical protein [Microbacterium liquefaciens]MBP5802383.1 hypothetical protein [Microbacterium liquefaciens]